MSACPFAGLLKSSSKFASAASCPFAKAGSGTSPPSDSRPSAGAAEDSSPGNGVGEGKSCETCPSSDGKIPEPTEVSGKRTPAGAAESNGLSLETRDMGSLPKSENLPSNAEKESENSKTEMGAKCPYGFDSVSFKIGPFSCVICKALLFETSRVVPCKHIFCRGCVSRFKDCPLCGVDVEGLESDEELQSMVDKFIEGHCRISSPQIISENKNNNEKVNHSNAENHGYNLSSSSSSLERGSFLLQQALRAFQAGNLSSARNRLQICLEDTKGELSRQGATSEIACQLGAILGSLGDCCRLSMETEEAIKHYEDSVSYLTSVPPADIQVVHALSVSLNKLGDLKYYDGELDEARTFYSKSLRIRQTALKKNENKDNFSLILDISVSLAKVADVDRAMGNEAGASQGFAKALKMATGVQIPSEMNSLVNRRDTMVEFIRSQMSV